MKARLRL
jgi:hypothetical protein